MRKKLVEKGELQINKSSIMLIVPLLDLFSYMEVSKYPVLLKPNWDTFLLVATDSILVEIVIIQSLTIQWWR